MTPDIYQNAFQQNIVRFKYKKLDGSTREAIGTTNLTVIERVGGKVPQSAFDPNSKSFSYFDLEKKEWRSISRENLASLEISKLERL